MLISLTSEQFATFFRTLSTLKDICNDVDIQEGLIRQRTSNTGAIFEMDLTGLISRISLPFNIIKPKLDMLKAFIGNNVDILIGERNFSFRDQYQTYTIENPLRQYITNTYITDEEMEALFSANEEDVILRHDIPKTVSDRIKVVTGVFNINTLQMHMTGENAHIEVKTQASDQSAKFLQGMVMEKVLKCSSNLVITPFIVDHDGDIEIKMYNHRDDECINKFSTYIDEVPITIYSKSSLDEED